MLKLGKNFKVQTKSRKSITVIERKDGQINESKLLSIIAFRPKK